MEFEGDTITLEIEYDPDELLRPFVFYLKREPWHHRVICRPQAVILNFLGGLAVLYFLDLISVTSVILAAIVAVLVSAFAPATIFLTAATFVSYLQHRYSSQFEKVRKLKYKFIFGPDGIRVEQGRDVEMTAWFDITEAIESELDVLLWHHEQSAYIFPKRIFQDFDELSHFKTFICDRIGERASF
jgi:hypothetical protein